MNLPPPIFQKKSLWNISQLGLRQFPRMFSRIEKRCVECIHLAVESSNAYYIFDWTSLSCTLAPSSRCLKRHFSHSNRRGAGPSIWVLISAVFQCSMHGRYIATSGSARRCAGNRPHMWWICLGQYLRSRNFGMVANSAFVSSQGFLIFCEQSTPLNLSILPLNYRMSTMYSTDGNIKPTEIRGNDFGLLKSPLY